MLLSKFNFTTANKKRGFFAKSSCFNFNKFFMSSGIKRKNIESESIAFSYCDMLHFIRQNFVAKVVQSEAFKIQNKFLSRIAERSVSGFPLQIIAFLRNR